MFDTFVGMFKQIRRFTLIIAAVIAALFAAASLLSLNAAQASPATKAAPAKMRPAIAKAADGTPEQVDVGIYMNQLLNVDLATNTYEADFYMWFRWKGDIDPTATYDFVNQTEAWAAKIVPTYEEPTVDATGVHYQGWHIQTKFVQRLDFSSYPKTGYRLHMLIEDNKYDESQLVYNVTDGLTSGPTVISPGGWDVTDLGATVGKDVYNTNFGDPASKAPATFSEADFSFTISRPDPTRVIKIVLPVLIIMAITLLAFLIPPRHLDARLLLTVTALISAVLMHDAAVAELPRVGYFVAIDKIYLLSYLVIFLTLLESAIVYRFASNGQEDQAKRIDRIALIALAALFLIGSATALLAG